MADGPGGREVGRISIRVVPNTSKFRQRLREQLQEIERTEEAEINVKADLNTAAAKAEMRALLAELKAQAASGVDVRVGIDKTLGARIQNMSQTFKSASTNAKAFGDAASFLNKSPDATWGVVLAAIGTLAAPAVGLVSGLLAGLPSLASGALAAFGAIELGMDGIKKAAADTGLFDVDKKGNAHLGAAFDEIKAKVSETFENGLKPAFQQIISMLPSLTAGFQGVATGLTSIFQGFTNAISSPEGLQQLQSILTNTGKLFEGLGPVVATATKSFLTLSDAGARSFGLLLQPLQTFASQFDAMVTRITTNGAFDGAMKGLSQTLTGVFSLFTKLMESGVTAMGQLGAPLESFFNGLGDTLAAIMPGLTGFSSAVFNIAGSLMTALAPALQAIAGPLGQVFQTLGGVIAENIKSLTPVITEIGTALGSGLTQALQAIQPMLPGLTKTFATLATTLAQQMGPMLPAIATAFGQLAGAIMQIAPAVLQALAQAFIAMAPSIGPIAQLIPGIATAFTTLLTAVTPLIPQIIQLATNFLQLAPSLLALAPIALQVVSAVVAVIDKFVEAGNKIAEFVANAISKIGELPGKIKEIASGFGTLLTSAGKALMDGLLSGIKAGFEAVKGFVSGIANTIASLKGPLPYDKRVLIPNGQALMEGLGTGLDTGFDDVMAKVKAMAKAIFQAFKEEFPNGGGPALAFNFSEMNSGLAQVGATAKAVKGDLNSALTGGVGSGKLTDEAKQMKANLDVQQQELELEKKKLAVQKAQTQDKAERARIQAQIDALDLRKKELAVQEQQVKMSGQMTQDTVDAQKQYEKLAKDGVKLAQGFATATTDSALQDLGIGGGAISTIGKEAVNWAAGAATNYVFNVSNADEAIAISKNKQNTQLLGVT